MENLQIEILSITCSEETEVVEDMLEDETNTLSYSGSVHNFCLTATRTATVWNRSFRFLREFVSMAMAINGPPYNEDVINGRAESCKKELAPCRRTNTDTVAGPQPL